MRTLFAVATILLTMCLPSEPARAAEPPTLTIIMDGSGSMWGKLDGERQAKFHQTRDAIRTGLARTGKDARVGFMSFGHRRGGDCSDVEMIVKPEPLSSDRISAALEKLNPRGRGPITRALQEAAKDLGPQSAPSSLIVIHDDLDNCQADPCSALGELRAAHPGVTVHVVALGLKPDDAQRMSCLPKATGGRLFEARTAAQVGTAIDEAIRLAMTAPPASAPGRSAISASPKAAPAPKTQPSAVATPGLKLVAVLNAGGAPIVRPIRWRIAPAGDAADTPSWQGDEASPTIVVPTGKYEIEARIGYVRTTATVDAVADQAQTVTVNLNAALVETGMDIPRSGTALSDTIFTLTRVDAGGGETIALQRGIEPQIAVVPGTYQASLTSGTLRAEQKLSLKAGDRVPLEAAFHVGALELSAVASQGGPVLDTAQFSVSEDDPDAPQGRREIATSAAPKPLFVLAAGTYYVQARYGMAVARERILVRAGEVERRAMSVNAAQMTVAIRLPGARGDVSDPLSVRVERLGADSRDTLVASRSGATFDVAAGRYRIEARLGMTNVIGEREIELQPGQREQVALDLPAGTVRLRVLDRPAGAPIENIAWDIRDLGGRSVWQGTETEARVVLAAGRYTVQAMAGVTAAGPRKLERQIEVKTGEVRTFDLTGLP